MIAKKKCCEEEVFCLPQTILLSREATEEVLGENFSTLLVIGKDGKQVHFLPYDHATPEVAEHKTCHSGQSNVMAVSITIPKALGRSQGPLRLVTNVVKKPATSALRCLCKFMGMEWYC